MRIVSIGGGPAGLYFAILMKKADPRHDILVLERNRRDDTFGFGVVFSDATLGQLEDADGESHAAISDSFYHWDDIDIRIKGEVITSTGHGFAGLERKRLLHILTQRALELGVQVEFGTDVISPEVYTDRDLVLGADGVNSLVRQRYAEHFQATVELRPNRFVWLGTTFPFRAFTFYFRENEHGLWRVHAYRYDREHSTFIVECTATTFSRSGLNPADEDATIVYLEKLFVEELQGHRLLKNRSLWRQFPTVSAKRWHHRNVVLLGDAVHTAHFSIGSGTRLAMEDAIALAAALHRHDSVGEALSLYEVARRPAVESLQRAAQVSLEWFEQTERYMGLEPVEFAASLLTRSLRLTHEHLRERDPEFAARINRHVAARAAAQTGLAQPLDPAPPPMFTPLKLRNLILPNRIVVSPMCQYSAEDGSVDDWHLVHLGSRAIGGAGLVITEMTDVSADGRITPGCAGMYKAEHAPAWKRVTDFVHRHSSAKIGMQIAHAGRKGATRRPWESNGEPLAADCWPLIAPSAIAWGPGSEVPRAMDRGDMDRVTADFVRATLMAHDAGFDLIELHAAHGYLLGSFLSPLTNRRNDDYGGTLARRLRFPLEVYAAVRATWPGDKPMSVRISASDWTPEGFSPEDAVEVARALKDLGCDIIDVSAGGNWPDQKPVYGRLFQTPFSERVRFEAGIATMTVGNISSWADANSIIAAGRADLCVLARAHLYDPYWTRHAAFDQGFALEWPDPYKALTRYTPRLR